MAIFKLESHLLTLDKDYLRGIPEFRVLIERDKGSKGDHDGRKKEYAFKEFYYIYIVADLYSYPNKAGENEKEVHKYAVKESGLEDNYKPDKEVKAAIIKYRELQDLTLPTLKTLTTVIRGLKTADKISQSIIDNIESTIETRDTKRKADSEAGNISNQADELLVTTQLVGQLTQLLSIGISIQKTIGTLSSLEEKLSKDESSNTFGRGGKSIGKRADPKQ